VTDGRTDGQTDGIAIAIAASNTLDARQNIQSESLILLFWNKEFSSSSRVTLTQDWYNKSVV